MTDSDPAARSIRLAVLPDFPEEGWPSMDLCAEMLLEHLGSGTAGRLAVQRVCPAFRRRFAKIPIVGRRGMARNADRLFNRFRTYPRFVKSLAGQFDLFHVCDQTYSQLLHSLPANSAGVYCHDLDVFRSLLEPRGDPRPRWYRAMMRRVLAGFQKAAIVFCTTETIRSEIEARGSIDPSKLIVAPNGIAPEFSIAGGTSALPDIANEGPFLLHVGSCIPRKRIDVLLDVFAKVRETETALRLVQIGGDWTAAQREQISRLNLTPAIRQLRGIARETLAEYYRRAVLVLQPSSAEGFGLPIVEALACGAPVLASDLPVLREVGGSSVVYAPVGDVRSWVDAVREVLHDPSRLPSRASRLAWASRFSWSNQAKTIADAYLQIMNNK